MKKLTTIIQRYLRRGLFVLLAGVVLYGFIGLIKQSSVNSRYTPTRRISLEQSGDFQRIAADNRTQAVKIIRVAVAPVISPET